MTELTDWIVANPMVAGGGAAGVVLIVVLFLVLIFRTRKRVAPSVALKPERVEPPVLQPAKPSAPVSAGTVEAGQAWASPPTQELPVPPKSAPMPVQQDEVIVADISLDSDDWVRPDGRPPIGRIEQGAYLLGASQGVRTRRALPAVEGHKYRMSFKVSAVKDATNGGRSNFLVGPLFLGADGKPVKWWQPQPDITVAEGQRSATVESVAPEGAESVCLGIHGSHDRANPPGDSIVAFSALELSRVV